MFALTNLLESGSTANTGNNTVTIILWVVLGVALVGFFVWNSFSNKKKQKKTQDMLNSIKIGDRVKTIGGVCGYAYEINEAENTITLKVGPEGHECYIKFDRGAIYQTASANVATAANPEEKIEEVKTEEVSQPEETVKEKPDTKAKKPAAKKKTAAKPEDKAE